MKLHEVFTPYVMSGKVWFRPRGWKKQAYAVKNECTYLVPHGEGGVLGMTPDTFYLAGEWELVEPEDVLDEKEWH